LSIGYHKERGTYIAEEEKPVWLILSVSIMSASQRFVQDMPPPGGFKKINAVRYIPKKGFSSLTLLGLATGITAYGLFTYIVKMKAKNEITHARAIDRGKFIPAIQEFVVEEREKKQKRIKDQIQRDVELLKSQVTK